MGQRELSNERQSVLRKFFDRMDRMNTIVRLSCVSCYRVKKKNTFSSCYRVKKNDWGAAMETASRQPQYISSLEAFSFVNRRIGVFLFNLHDGDAACS